MYIKNRLNELFSQDAINVFVDMDGVITDYNFGGTIEFKNKRPLFTNIATLKDLSEDKNIRLYILSICKTKDQIADKNQWLDKYAPFFSKHQRYIIPKSEYPNKASKELKLLALTHIIAEKELNNICLIDDDNAILKYLKDSNLDIVLFHVSSIID